MSFEKFKKTVGDSPAIIQYSQKELYGKSWDGNENHTLGYYKGKFVNPWNGKIYDDIESASIDMWHPEAGTKEYCNFEDYNLIRYFE